MNAVQVCRKRNDQCLCDSESWHDCPEVSRRGKSILQREQAGDPQGNPQKGGQVDAGSGRRWSQERHSGIEELVLKYEYNCRNSFLREILR